MLSDYTEQGSFPLSVNATRLYCRTPVVISLYLWMLSFSCTSNDISMLGYLLQKRATSAICSSVSSRSSFLSSSSISITSKMLSIFCRRSKHMSKREGERERGRERKDLKSSTTYCFYYLSTSTFKYKKEREWEKLQKDRWQRDKIERQGGSLVHYKNYDKPFPGTSWWGPVWSGAVVWGRSPCPTWPGSPSGPAPWPLGRGSASRYCSARQHRPGSGG